MTSITEDQKDRTSKDEDEEEVDEWDKRIFSTGCANEQNKLNDCYFERKDWRACKAEIAYDQVEDTQLEDLMHTMDFNTISEAQNSARAPPPTSDRTARHEVVHSDDLTAGLSDKPIELDESARQVDWARSFHGLSTEAFSKEAAEALLAPIVFEDIEVKPDGIVYLPEIKYRRILNKAFGPGAWGLAPRGETIVTAKAVTREYALVAMGRLVSVARGEMDYFSPEGIPTAVEGCKSNALMRCCKDLGVASELWDPRFIRKFIATHAKEVWVEHAQTQKRRKIWMRKDDQIRYPFKIYTPTSQAAPRPSMPTSQAASNSSNSKY
ncbi:MAG: hypothetical protein Q9218_002173 [Villophora microphyllina]